MKKLLFSLGLFFLSINTLAQKAKADSLALLLFKEKIDTNRVTLMWKLANVTRGFDPQKALALSREALYLADNINYIEGKSRSLGALAGTFTTFGNYPRALEYYFEKLKVEEQRDHPRNMASTLISIGIVYVYQEEYNKALQYYYKADSLIRIKDIQDLKYHSLQNLGDIYDRLNLSDSSYAYFNKAFQLAKQFKDVNHIGASMTGLGHSYLKKENLAKSLYNYHSAISYLQAANNDDLLCEATLGLAKLHEKLNRPDSTEYYARFSLGIARNSNFLLRDFEAAKFLATHFKGLKRIDSAFTYLDHVQVLNDSLNSKSRIRELQVMSSNEQLRQIEMEENKKIERKKRMHELQLLSIGIFIPVFLLVILILSRIKMNVKLIKLLGILSLLFLFEYINLLIHPFVMHITNHEPVYQLLVYVIIAATLIPIHHRIEHWLIEKLVHNRQLPAAERIVMKKAKFKIKDRDE